jgi:cellulose synthase/poly-beta-1,6-N-acetylglucosamine synthase-like glycosyltransferase/transposase
MTAQDKLRILAEVHSSDLTQEEIAAKYGVSRITLYNWKKQLKTRGNLENNYASGINHYKTLSEDIITAVLPVIAAHPDFSASQLYLYINDVVHLAIGYGTVQSILERYQLNSKTDRMIYAAQHGGDITPISDSRPATSPALKPIGQSLDPNIFATPPPASNAAALLSKLIPAFTPQTLPTLPLIKHSSSQMSQIFALCASGFVTWIVASTLINLVIGLTIAQTLWSMLGVIFAFFALSIGMIFFFYSLKYYFSIISILFFSRKNQLGTGEKPGFSQKGLSADLSQMTLRRLPFISIHLPVYNERRVVNRLLEAATSLTYENYEVIVCDDSTDETTQIVNEWRNHPKVKISHRESREGFKGGALGEAVKLMDARTEFVLVFDADFLPYPDTITQFLKYYQVATEGEGSRFKVSGSSEKESFVTSSNYNLEPSPSPVAAIQGYQWHVLNKSENWITRGVRTEYAGSYVIERSGSEVYGGLKQIAGSVFMVRADILRDPKYAWGKSITEDFELTLKLYRDGYKVIYTPYVQAPSECVSTLKRLIRQRMRWAEGHSFNIKRYYGSLMKSKYMSRAEKFEFIYLSPYYLQSFLFLIGTFAWFLSEAVFKVQLPYWTAVWGWSLVLTNLLSLPLMNTVGLFLEESESKDFAGIASFMLLTYIVAPFQGYASVKGFLEAAEGPWFRTPKTGRITDSISRTGRFYQWISGLFNPRQPRVSVQASTLSFQKHSIERVRFNLNISRNSGVRPGRTAKFASRTLLILLLMITVSLTSLPRAIPTTEATNPSNTKWYVRDQEDGDKTPAHAIVCPTATNCKLAYSDNTNKNLIFFDCDDAQCKTGTRTVVVSSNANNGVSLSCPASDDCKIVYQDTSASDVKFVDCDNETCSSNSQNTVDGAGVGNCLTGCTTNAVGSYMSMYCVATDDCKIAYRDSTGTNLVMADCDNAACSTGNVTIVDGDVASGLTGETTDSVGIGPGIYCLTSTDCKIAYFNTTNSSLSFADCDSTACTTGTISKLDGIASCVLTNCNTAANAGDLQNGIDCPATDDCKIAYFEQTNFDLRVADCSTATCSAGTTSLVDGRAGCLLTNCTATITGVYDGIHCLTATDCKVTYYDNTNTDLWFADCDTSSVTCDSGTVNKLDGVSGCLLTNCDTTTDAGSFGSINCPTATDCKLLYYNATGTDVVFGDCDDATCSTGTKITIDGNKIINATTGSVTTGRLFGATGDSFIYVSDVQYPNGTNTGSLGSGTYTLNLRFDTNTISGTLTWNYEVGYCTVASDCTTRTAHITSANQSLTSGTTSPQTPTTSTASSLTIPAPVSSNWIYVKIAVVTAPASGKINIRMNNTSGNTADTYIDIPALSVPELIIMFMPLSIIAPLILYRRRRRRRENIKFFYA